MNLKKIIREEIGGDDLDWIRDITPYGYEPQIGDLISVVNTGDKNSFLNWLGDYRYNYTSGRYGQNITGTVVERHKGYADNTFNFFYLKEFYTDGLISFPKLHHLEEMRGLDSYKGLNLSYIPLPKDTINESENDDLDWIRDVQLTTEQVLVKILTSKDPNYRVMGSPNGDEIEIYDAEGMRYFGILKYGDIVTLEDILKQAKKEYEFCVNENVSSVVTAEYKFIYDQIRNYLNVNESIKILNSIKVFINEDGKTEPDMVWDFPEVKKKLDLSKKWVKTKEDVVKYLNLLLDRFRSIPYKLRLKIFKYVAYSFLGLLTINQIVDVEEQVKNGVDRIELKAENIINKTKKLFKKESRIRKPSEKLIDHLKWEEGSITRKGEPVLTAYDLGDGAYTIGYGHAVFSDPSRGDNGGKYDFLPKYNQIVPGKTKITPEQAEILLRDDVSVASEALNEILNDWESKGIKPKITQNMYDAMVSMIFNMGRGGFRQTKFIQLVKRGKLKSAKEQIKKESEHMFDKYPGLKTRREKESKLFSGHE